jgi:hypothetical protein
MWYIACIYLVMLLYLGISLEGELVEPLLPILGGVYFMISWSFGMVKTLIRPYLLEFALFEITHLLSWALDYFISYGALHLLGSLRFHTCGLVACILWTTFYFWRMVMEHSPRKNILLLYLSCTLEGPLSTSS